MPKPADGIVPILKQRFVPAAQPDFLRFSAIGAMGFCVDEGVLAAMQLLLHLGPLRARLISVACAMTCTWLGNRNFTFAEQRAVGRGGIAREWLRFCAANSFGAVINYLTFAALLHIGPSPLNNSYLAAAAGAGVGALFNFTLSRHFVFRAG